MCASLYVLQCFSHRPGEYSKPLPPPKTASYKPIPPPKPKNYRLPSNGPSDHQSSQMQWRSPTNGTDQNYGGNDNTPQRPNKLNLGLENGINSPHHHSNNSIYQHSKSFSLAGGMESHQNGVCLQTLLAAEILRNFFEYLMDFSSFFLGNWIPWKIFNGSRK